MKQFLHQVRRISCNYFRISEIGILKFILILLFTRMFVLSSNAMVPTCPELIPTGNPTAPLASSEVSWDITDNGTTAILNSFTVVGEPSPFTDLIMPDAVQYQFADPQSDNHYIIDGANIEENITQGSVIFDPALLDAMTDRDLRHYLSLDYSITPTDYTQFMYNIPIKSAKNRYVLVTERHGNNTVTINALDANGSIIGTSAVAITSENRINSGYRELGHNQYIYFTVYPLTALVSAGTYIHGIRLTQTGAPVDGGDGKVFLMADPFTMANSPVINLVDVTQPDCSLLASGEIRISAQGISGYDLEYSIDGGASFQADTAFTNQSPGEYSIRVRYVAYPYCYTDGSDVVLNEATCLDDDNDGIPNGVDLDDDNDGILNTDEGYCESQTVYNLDVDATIAGAAIAANGGSLDLVYTLSSGTEVSGLGAEFTIPLTYSDFNNTATAQDHQWEGISAVTIGNAEYINILANTTLFYTGLPDNNKKDYATPTSADAAFRQRIIDGTIDVLGTFNLTIGNVPQPINNISTLFSEAISISSGFNGELVSSRHISGFYSKVRLQSEIYSGVEARTVPLSVLHGDTYIYDYTAFSDNAPSGAGHAGGTRGTARISEGEIIFCNHRDTDKDGTPDYLDVDSDGDGCPDAVEGDANYTFSDIDGNYRLTGGIDADGVPIAGAQGVGTSIDGSAQNEACQCDANSPYFLDADGDAVGDYCDLDDDNDGVLDTDECLNTELSLSGATATQSSTNNGGAIASRAIDGNTDGNYNNGSVTHTSAEINPWWELVINTAYIKELIIWNRNAFQARLDNFIVEILDANSSIVYAYHHIGSALTSTNISSIDVYGSTIRVRLEGANRILSLAEVQVFTCSDTDNDGTLDYLDVDSDGDGCSDANEAYGAIETDSNGDGTYGGVVGPSNVNADGTVTSASYVSPATTATGEYTFQQGVSISITTPSVNKTICAGSNAVFTAAATTTPVTTASTDLNYQWQVSADGGTTFTNITGESGTVASGTEVLLTVANATATMNNNIYKAVFTNEANICGAETEAVLTVIDEADLELTKTVDNTTPNVGDEVTFTITVINKGPCDATGITVQDNLPSALVYVSSNTSVGTYNPNTGIWDFNTTTLNINDTAILTVTVRIDPSCGTISSTAEIMTSSRPDPDSEPGFKIE